MTEVLAFFSALIFSFVGVLPPGLVNMSVADIAVNKSIKQANHFIKGALIIVGLQSLFGFYLATFLDNHPTVMQHLKLVGCILFSILTLFFTSKGIQSLMQQSKAETKIKSSKLPPFYYGIVLSIFNVFPIPYYAFLSLFFSGFIDSFFSITSGLFFVLGVILGSAFVFLLYKFIFVKFQNKIPFFINNINFIIAIISAIITLFTILDLNK